jgi:hypothetical protein
MAGKIKARTYTIENVTFVEFKRPQLEEDVHQQLHRVREENGRLLAGLAFRLQEGRRLMDTLTRNRTSHPSDVWQPDRAFPARISGIQAWSLADPLEQETSLA